jgi:hypothetical protein
MYKRIFVGRRKQSVKYNGFVMVASGGSGVSLGNLAFESPMIGVVLWRSARWTGAPPSTGAAKQDAGEYTDQYTIVDPIMSQGPVLAHVTRF